MVSVQQDAGDTVYTEENQVILQPSVVSPVVALDNLQKDVLEKLSLMVEKGKPAIESNFKEYFLNYKKDGAKVKKGNKGGPMDNWFERCLSNILKRNPEGVFKYTYQDFNEFVVPDIIELCEDFVLCLDGKTNSDDSDGKLNKVHFGVNQSNLGNYSFKNYVSKNPEENWGTFKGDIVPYYKDKPTLCYISKIVYDYKTDEPQCISIHLYCIPHRDTIDLYKEKIKRGCNKSKDEQRLEINDESLFRVINFQ